LRVAKSEKYATILAASVRQRTQVRIGRSYPSCVLPHHSQTQQFAMRTTSCSMTSGDRLKSMQPLAMARGGMSG